MVASLPVARTSRWRMQLGFPVCLWSAPQHRVHDRTDRVRAGSAVLRRPALRLRSRVRWRLCPVAYGSRRHRLRCSRFFARSFVVGRGFARSIIRDKIIASDRPMALLRTLPPLGEPPAVVRRRGMLLVLSCMARVMASPRTLPPLGVRRYRRATDAAAHAGVVRPSVCPPCATLCRLAQGAIANRRVGSQGAPRVVPL